MRKTVEGRRRDLEGVKTLKMIRKALEGAKRTLEGMRKGWDRRGSE